MDSKHGKATKQTVRAFLADRVYEPEPVPTMEEIRQQLGWNMLEVERGYKREEND
jgi:hypothetical protein